jgi:hypothetical protein
MSDKLQWKAFDIHAVLSSIFCCVPCPLTWSVSKQRLEFKSSPKRVRVVWILIVCFVALLTSGCSLVQLIILYSRNSGGLQLQVGSTPPSSCILRYIEFLIPTGMLLCSFDLIVMGSSVYFCGKDVVVSFNFLIDFEIKMKTLTSKQACPNLKEKLLGFVLCWMCLSSFLFLLEVWTLCIVIFGLHPLEQIIVNHFEHFYTSSYFLVKGVIFIGFWVVFSEFIRLVIIFQLIMLIAPIMVNEYLVVMHRNWKSRSIYLAVSGDNTFLQLYRELGLAVKFLAPGTLSTGSVNILVAMCATIGINFIFIRLNADLSLWITMFLPITSFTCGFCNYVCMARMADLNVTSKRLILLWKCSSRILVSRKYVYKCSVACRPITHEVQFIGNKFRTVDRPFIVGYFVKIMDYTIAALLAIP